MTLERPMFPPVDPTRRHLLTVVAGGAVAATIPTAVLAAAPAVDPIYAAIERHNPRHYHAARERLGMGDLNMADMAQGTLFILACAFLYGLTVFLFRDQIKSRR
jgi:hypothetical protein